MKKVYTKALLVFFIILIGMSTLVWMQFKNFELDKDTKSIATKIEHLDEVLTMSARMAAYTGDKVWISRYDNNVIILDQVLKEAKKDKDISSYINSIDSANQKLVEIELKSFDLIKQNKLIQAQELLSSVSYEKYKNEYSKGLNSIVFHLNEKHDKNTNKLAINYQNSLLIIIVLLIFVTIFVLYIIHIMQEYNQTLKTKTDQFEEIVNKFRFASDNALAGSWEIDLDTNLVSFSDGWFEFLGYELSDFSNTTTEEILDNLIYSEDSIKVKEAVENFLTGKSDKYEIQFRIKKKDESYCWVQALGTVYNNKFFGFHVDISELKNVNLKLTQQTKLASMGEMIGNIAHQWRQPLSVISTSATGLLLQKQYNNLTDEDLVKMCNSINENAQYLSKTIDDFRNFIKGDREKIYFKLSDSIHSFLNLVEGNIKHSELNIKLDLDDTIELNTYSNELIQCWMNLFHNSKDALNDKDYDKYITINTYKDKHSAIIVFKDNGGGISEDIISRIFEPYFTTKHQSLGTGLGLSLVYSLITEGMDGKIDCENISYIIDNEIYKGVEFKITLPL